MSAGKILATEVDNVPVLKLTGDVRVVLSGTLDNYFGSLYRRAILDSMVVDLREAEGIDSTTLGLLAKMAIQLRNRFNVKPTIVSTNPDISRILMSMSFDLICTISETADAKAGKAGEFSELRQVQETEDSVRRKVIEAHQTLMTLSEDNRAEFQELVVAVKAGR